MTIRSPLYGPTHTPAPRIFPPPPRAAISKRMATMIDTRSTAGNPTDDSSAENERFARIDVAFADLSAHFRRTLRKYLIGGNIGVIVALAALSHFTKLFG